MPPTTRKSRLALIIGFALATVRIHTYPTTTRQPIIIRLTAWPPVPLPQSHQPHVVPHDSLHGILKRKASDILSWDRYIVAGSTVMPPC